MKAAIGIKNENGTITAIYCKNDGFLEGVGKTLLENYTTPELIQTLINGGNLNRLNTTLDTSEYLPESYHKSYTAQNISDFERYFHKMLCYYLYIDDKWFYHFGEDRVLTYANLSHALKIKNTRSSS